MSAPRSTENGGIALNEAITEISRQGQEIVRLNLADERREMRAFVAGWFAHARNDDGTFVEDAYRAYRAGECERCGHAPALHDPAWGGTRTCMEVVEGSFCSCRTEDDEPTIPPGSGGDPAPATRDSRS